MLSPEEVTQRKQQLAQKRVWKQKQKRKNIITFVIVMIVGCSLMGVSAYYSFHQGLRQKSVPHRSEKLVSNEDSEYKRTHILFLGTDDKGDSASRTDTIFLAALDPSSGQAGIITIPRDTRIYIPERERWDRVNALHVYGGPELTVKTVSEFLGVDIDYYIETDFQGFSRIVDTLGGIDIDVEKDMYYEDIAGEFVINIKSGQQVLDGDKALGYVRYRDHLGDIALVDPQYESYGGRVERQRKFVMALIDEILQPSTILKLPRLLQQLWDAVDTNIPWTLALKLAFAADRFTNEKIETAVVPGDSERISGAWYWIPDDDKTRQIVDWIIKGIPLPLTAEVLNGCGIAGIAARAADSFAEFEFDVKNVGNAEDFNYPVTEIIVSSKSMADRVGEFAENINAEILIDPYRDSPLDVTIIIGRNYQPL